jgi:hypothetical protein
MLNYGYDCLSVRDVRDAKTGEYHNMVCFEGGFNKLELYIDNIDILLSDGAVYIDAQYKSTTMNLIQLALSKRPKGDENAKPEES